jgi:hypothetical protein
MIDRMVKHGFAAVSAVLKAEAAENAQGEDPGVSDLVRLAERLLPCAKGQAKRRKTHRKASNVERAAALVELRVRRP